MNVITNFNLTNVDLTVENCLVWYIVHKPPSSYIWNSIAACVVNIVFAVAGTVLNLLVLLTFWKSTKLRTKLSYFTIMILSCVDLGVTTVVQPLSVSHLIKEVLGTPECSCAVSYFFILAQASTMSFCTLFITNIERYVAIVHPIWYFNYASKRNFMLAWTFLCLGFTAFLLTAFMSPSSMTILFSVTVPVIFGPYIFTCVSIFRVARKKLTKIDQEDNASRRGNFRMAFLREVKMARILLVLAFLFFIAFLPAGVMSLMQNPWDKGERSNSLTYGWVWACTIMSTSSTLNCLIFFWCNNEMRREGTKIINQYFAAKHNTQLQRQTSSELHE